MSDTEIRVWFCVFLLSIITLFALVAYLLGMVRFLTERMAHAEDRIGDDISAIFTLTKALRWIYRESQQAGGDGMTMENAQAIAETGRLPK